MQVECFSRKSRCHRHRGRATKYVNPREASEAAATTASVNALPLGKSTVACNLHIKGNPSSVPCCLHVPHSVSFCCMPHLTPMTRFYFILLQRLLPEFSFRFSHFQSSFIVAVALIRQGICGGCCTQSLSDAATPTPRCCLILGLYARPARSRFDRASVSSIWSGEHLQLQTSSRLLERDAVHISFYFILFFFIFCPHYLHINISNDLAI